MITLGRFLSGIKLNPCSAFSDTSRAGSLFAHNHAGMHFETPCANAAFSLDPTMIFALVVVVGVVVVVPAAAAVVVEIGDCG